MLSSPHRRRPALLLFTLAAALLVPALGPRTAAAQAPGPDGNLKIPAPELPEKQKWLNSPPLTMAKLRGKVVLVDFWEYTCVNCIRTMPYLKAWNDKYKDKGLVIIGVHTPEFKFAKEEANVAAAVKSFGLTYPILVDSNYDVWNTYGNRFWPAKYLIDAQGNVRSYHFGEGGYEANPNVELPAITKPLRGTDKPGAVCYPMTPEMYAGYQRGGMEHTLGNREGYQPEKIFTYREAPGPWQDGHIYLQGPWQNAAEALISTRENPAAKDYLAIKYHALEVNSVIKPENGKPVRVWVYHDGKPVAKKDAGADIQWDSQGRSFLMVEQPRMYAIVKNAVYGQRLLKLAPEDGGLGIYSFTFVSCEQGKRS